METSITAGWSDFFVAASGIAGALAGLVFVAISINLARILELPGISGRAAETIALLSGTLAGCLIALIPHLSSVQLGIGLLIAAVPTWMTGMAVQIHSVWNRNYFG